MKPQTKLAVACTDVANRLHAIIRQSDVNGGYIEVLPKELRALERKLRKALANAGTPAPGGAAGGKAGG